MDPSALIPTPQPIPVHWGWFEGLSLLTFVLHLLAMNAMVGTAIVALAEHLRARGAAPPASREAAVKLPFLIAFAINLGVAPLLFVQVLYGQFVYTGMVLMAVFALSIVGLLIVAYTLAYLYKLKLDALGARGPWVIGLSLALLLAVGFLFANLFSLAVRPEAWERWFASPGGTLLNLDDPTLWPRWLHAMTAAVAVGGLTRALWWRLKERRGAAGEGESAAQVRTGLHWFAFATMAQVPVGSWYLAAQPAPLARLLMGGSAAHTGVLLAGVALSVAVIATALRGRLWLTTAGLVAVVGLMAVGRELLRQARLAEWFHPARLEVEHQASPLVVFLAALVFGLAAVAWMLRQAWLARRGGGAG